MRDQEIDFGLAMLKSAGRCPRAIYADHARRMLMQFIIAVAYSAKSWDEHAWTS